MARYSGGWIKLYRKLLEDEDISRNPILLSIFVTLLLWTTRFETNRHTTQKSTAFQALPPGSVIFGVRELATHLHLSKDTTLRWLRYLERRDTVILTSDARGTVVTICNWKRFQDKDEKNDQDTENSFSDTPKKPLDPHYSSEIRDGYKKGETPEFENLRHQRDTGEPRIEEYKNQELIQATVVPITGRLKKVKTKHEYPQSFEWVWKSYETEYVKGSKKKAFEAFLRLKLGSEEVKTLIRAIQVYLAKCKKTNQATQHLVTFLNEDDWETHLEIGATPKPLIFPEEEAW